MRNRNIIASVAFLIIAGAFYIGKAPKTTEKERAQPDLGTHSVVTVTQKNSAILPVVTLPSIAPQPPLTQSTVTDWRTYDPESMTFAAFPDLPISFRRVDSVMNEQLDRRVWVGVTDAEGTYVTTAASKTEMVAVLTIPGADTYEFTITNAGTQIRQIPQVSETCTPIVPKAQHSLPQVLVQAQALAADIATVDLAVFYNTDTLAAAGSESTILTTVLARITAANQALTQSGITNVQWNLLGVYAVGAYTTTDNLQDDLRLFTDASSSIGKFALAKAVEVGADQSLLLVGGSRGTTTGMSYILGSTSAAIWSQTSSYIIAHELAHNFGCNHDRATMNAPDGNGQFYYGHTLSVNGTNYGTIMAYQGIRVGYYSNPNVNYQNVPTGVATNQPKAAYNAKVMMDYAATMCYTSLLRWTLPRHRLQFASARN